MDGATVLNNHSRISRAGKRQYHLWLFSGTSLEINLFQRFVFILLLWAPQTSFSNNDKENTKHSVPEISQSVAVPDSSNSPVVSLDTSTVPVLPSVETDLQEADDSEEVPVYVLEDFVVTTEQDRGYYSANALAGTRTNQALKDTPMTVSVINQQLIEDLNLSLMDDIGAAMAGVEEEGESFSNNILRLRSFQVRNQLFEFFPRSAALNFYNIERVEVIRGANSLVYGQASPGGKANMLPKKALFENDKLKVETEQGENGYSRTTVDANYQINDKVAVRLMGVTLQSEFDQRYKLFEFDGATAAVTFRPNQRTSLDLHLEYLDGVRNNPRAIEKNQTHRLGYTGILTDLPMTPDVVGLLSEGALNEIIQHEDKLAEYIASGIPNSAEINRINQNLDRRQLNIESAEDLKQFLSPILYKNVGSTSGPDNVRDSSGGYILGNLTHRFTDDLSLKFSAAHESMNGDHLLRLGNPLQLSSGTSPKSDKGLEPNANIEYDPENPDPDVMPSPVQKLYWRSQDVDNRIHALRTTFSLDAEVFGTKQQLLLGLDFDRITNKLRSYDLTYDGAKVSDTGYWDPRSRVQDYFRLSDLLSSNSPGIRYNNKSDFSQNFNSNAGYWELNPRFFNQFINIEPGGTLQGRSGHFQLSEKKENRVHTSALWLAAQGSYMRGRLNTLFGVRLDHIQLKSEVTNYFLTNTDASSTNPTSDRVTGRDPLYSRTKAHYTHASPTIGGLLWLNDSLAVFGNFAKSIQSPIGAQLDPTGKNIDPEYGTGYEGGIKFEFLDGQLSGQLTTYLIKKKNDHLTRLTNLQLETLYPEDEYEDIYVNNGSRNVFTPVGRQVGGITVEAKGFEADIFYNPTSRHSLSLAYAYSDPSFKSTPGGIADGFKYPGFAFHSVNLIGRYSFDYKGPLKGFYVGGNQKYRSESYYNKLYVDIDGDTRADAADENARSYELWLEDHFETTVFFGWSGLLKKAPGDPRLNLQLTVNNLFDEIDLINTGLTARYTNGRRFSLRASLQF